MSIVRIELGDWLKNAAIVGLIKILNKKQDLEHKVIIKSNYVEFDTVMLDGFEDEYFRTLVDENEKNISWYKLISVEPIINNLELKENETKDIDILNNIIDEFKNKLNSNSYKNAYLILDDTIQIKENEKMLTKIKLKKKQSIEEVKDDIKKQCSVLKNIIKYLRQPEVKRIIAAKNVMYDIVQPFWTNVSFLLKTNNQKDMYILYKSDFIDTAINYIESDKSKNKYFCFTCDNKISKFSKPEAYDLTWLVKTGVDMSRKSSHFWNMNGDAYICPICNLLYSCLPLGFMSIKGKGIFINNNHTVKSIVNSNSIKVQDQEKTFEDIEQLSYLNIVNSMEQYNIKNFEKEFENIQVVKIDGNNASRPYTFNVLSKKLMYIIYKNRKALNQLIKIRIKISDKYYINLYDEIVKRLYDGKNLFDIISQLIFLQLNGKFKGTYYIYKILEINNDVIGGVKMNYKDTQEFKNYGLALRKSYIEKNSESKLSGITYRLLNALKTKDSSKFMDTLINSYMYMKSAIPTNFVKALNNQEVFQGVGYAFLIGLQGLDESKVNKSENEEAK